MSSNFANNEAEILKDLYSRTGLTVDQLPFTAEFEQMRNEFNARVGENTSDKEFLRRLMNLRKKGGLKKRKPR